MFILIHFNIFLKKIKITTHLETKIKTNFSG